MALRPKLNRVWTSANSVLRRDPGDAKYIQGWISEIPTYQVLNFLQFKVDTTLLAQAERGIFEWGTDVQYGLGSIVWCENDKKIYVAIVGSPDRNKSPNTNLAHWSPSSIQVPRAEYDAIVSAINAHIANKANPHDLTASQLGSYTKAETDALVAQYNALVSAHVNDKNNPHGVTAVDIGAVPVTGGTYTGDVTFNGGMYFDAGKVNQISKTGGLYLQANTAVMGIDATGVPVIGTTSSKSPIVSEINFPTLKAAQEPDFAAPDPVIKVDLLGSLAMSRGRGLMQSTGFEPNYSAVYGGAVIFDQDVDSGVNKFIEMPATQALYAMKDLTLALDVYVDAFDGDAGEQAYRFEMFQGSDGTRIGIRNSGKAFANRVVAPTNTQTPDVQLVASRWNRLVVTADATTVKFFVNGKLVGTIDASTTYTATLSKLRLVCYRTALTRRLARIRNVRVWDSALTDKQVSTL